MATSLSNKDEIISRSKVLIAGFIIFGILILSKIAIIQTSQKKELMSLVEDMQEQQRVIDATRGNIYATDGSSLLATSIPKYKIIIDPSQAKSKLFKSSVDSLSLNLSKILGKYRPEVYKQMIIEARRKNLKYLELTKLQVDHNTKLRISRLPLFREGKLKGGGRFEVKESRYLPYNNLAMRTIGKMDRTHTKEGGFGIEAGMNNYLQGKDGKGFYERLAGGARKPIDSDSDINAEAGFDVVSTIDINFQDIVESSLRSQVIAKQAKYGSAVVMEITTGEIKAIANLTRYVNSENKVSYSEEKNFAVVEGTDPGSTFKLVSMAAILEKSGLKNDDYAVDCPGEIKHRGLSFTCSHKHGHLTVQQVFEQSCNIGVYNLMRNTFGFKKADAYFEYIEKFQLTKRTGFQLKGEAYPLIKNQKSSTFSMTTVPWMSIGYETRITPLQMLAFYNAIANKGYWVQPLLIKEIKKGGVSEKIITANKLSTPMISLETYSQIAKMMEGVITNGTAKNVNYGNCKIAGKTGTTQKRNNGSYRKGQYYTSFIGYFPADKPKYSCVVVIDEPVGSNVYAADVSAPVFRNIAEKIYAYDIEVHQKTVLNPTKKELYKQFNAAKSNYQKVILNTLGIEFETDIDAVLAPIVLPNGKLAWKNKSKESLQKMILGMTLRDALPILENQGFEVRYTGIGKISKVQQSGNKTILLTLK